MTTKRTPPDDLALIQSFASDCPRDGQVQRARDWFHWRSSTAVRCPRALAGKRCRQYHDGDNTCICIQLHYPLLDHAARWITAEGEPILTAEPYDFSGQDFADLVAACNDLGLRVSVNGTSPYFPGRTTLIIIRKAQQ